MDTKSIVFETNDIGETETKGIIENEENFHLYIRNLTNKILFEHTERKRYITNEVVLLDVHKILFKRTDDLQNQYCKGELFKSNAEDPIEGRVVIKRYNRLVGKINTYYFFNIIIDRARLINTGNYSVLKKNFVVFKNCKLYVPTGTNIIIKDLPFEMVMGDRMH